MVAGGQDHKEKRGTRDSREWIEGGGIGRSQSAGPDIKSVSAEERERIKDRQDPLIRRETWGKERKIFLGERFSGREKKGDGLTRRKEDCHLTKGLVPTIEYCERKRGKEDTR